MPEALRTILHVDMDAFYAAVEQRDHPELRGKPVIVGSPPNKRGVVSAASYEARRFGVHSAMPSRTAFKRCPHAVFLPVRMEHYVAVSRQVRQVFLQITPMMEPISIDEAFLDVRSALSIWSTATDAARELKRRIRQELHLTASVGVAPNKFLAKLASDLDKPDGLTVVPTDPAQIKAFLAPLPARRIWGVGRVTAARLAQHNITTIGQIQALTPAEMSRLLGVGGGYHIWRLAQGQDDRPVQADKTPEKSISNEETFPEDCSDPAIVRQTLIELTEKVGRRLRRTGRSARVVQIKVRFGDFTTITRQSSLGCPTDHDRELLARALELYGREQVNQPVRLIGFGVTRLTGDKPEEEHQLMLFPDAADSTQEQGELDRAVDLLREQYGNGILKRGNWQV